MKSQQRPKLVERRDRGVLRHPASTYGTSVDGMPLRYYGPATSASTLIMATIHGDETETTVAVSEAMRCLDERDLEATVIICANPDGMLRGTRGNARGVDLNRNFPTSNWSPEPVFHKTRANDARDIALSPGPAPASEPETKALLELIERLKPNAIITLHSALACIDDAGNSHIAKTLATRCELPLIVDIGYPTPGSMGTWAKEKGITLVTWELEDASLYTLKDRHVPILIDLMTNRLEAAR